MATTESSFGRGRIYDDITQTIGNTPLIRLRRVSERVSRRGGREAGELQPALVGQGSDRRGDDRRGRGRGRKITKDTVIIEPTSGNTGIALAFTCAARGYRLIVTMPESMSLERRRLLKAFGAEIVLTPAAEGMPVPSARPKSWSRTRRASFMPQQFKNPANPEIHRRTTAEEIWRDTDGKIDILVSGVGTGGTITGCGEVLKSRKPSVQIVAVEPVNSPVISQLRRKEAAPSRPAQDPGHRRGVHPRRPEYLDHRRGDHGPRRRGVRDVAPAGPRGGDALRHLLRRGRVRGDSGRLATGECRQARRRRSSRPGRTLSLDAALPRVIWIGRVTTLAREPLTPRRLISPPLLRGAGGVGTQCSNDAQRQP